MEHSSGKIDRLMLAAGMALALTAAAWQFFSPASREVMSGRDVRLALLGDSSSVLLVYHPFSSTVNAFTYHHRRARRGSSPLQRAGYLISAASGKDAGEDEDVFFIELSSAPALEALWEALNGWRENPRLLARSAAWVYARSVSGDTNLSGFDLFCLFSEFAGLDSSDFILTDVSRKGPAADDVREAAGRAPLVEVFNASGRNGLANLVSKRLRAAGFDVITVGNSSREKQTRILGYSRDAAPALTLRKALGLEELEIRIKPSHKSVAAAAVVLGEDFADEKLEGKGR